MTSLVDVLIVGASAWCAASVLVLIAWCLVKIWEGD